jgi:hypothetical protein
MSARSARVVVQLSNNRSLSYLLVNHRRRFWVRSKIGSLASPDRGLFLGTGKPDFCVMNTNYAVEMDNFNSTRILPSVGQMLRLNMVFFGVQLGRPLYTLSDPRKLSRKRRISRSSYAC